MVVVELALEAIQHVVNVGETVLFQILASFLRAVARPAYQDHRSVMRGGHAHLAEKMRVQIPIDALVPGDQDGADRVADKKKFKFRAAIDQYRISLFLN